MEKTLQEIEQAIKDAESNLTTLQKDLRSLWELRCKKIFEESKKVFISSANNFSLNDLTNSDSEKNSKSKSQKNSRNKKSDDKKIDAPTQTKEENFQSENVSVENFDDEKFQKPTNFDEKISTDELPKNSNNENFVEKNSRQFTKDELDAMPPNVAKKYEDEQKKLNERRGGR